MPSVILNRKEFEKLVGKKLPEAELKDRISMLGTDLGEVTDKDIHVEVFPNRPDWLSEQGIARSLRALLGVQTGLREYPVKKSGLTVIVDSSVSMRPYTACAIVKNLTFNDERIREIMQVQEKLATTHGRNRKKSAYGIYPSAKINFPIRYTAKDPKEVTFHALGLSSPMTADLVEQVHPKAKEYSGIAKGWKKYPFFIDSKENILCMLPYTNSDDTGKVEEETKEVFIECTGTDFANVHVALAILCTTLADMGGEVYSIDIEYPDKIITTPDMAPKRMKIDRSYVNRLLGLNLTEKNVADLLGRMNYGYEKGDAFVPAYRADVLHPIDLVEDIAIAYGYENFEEVIPSVATIGERDAFEGFKRKITTLLVGLGFMETASYHLIDKAGQTTKVGMPGTKKGAEKGTPGEALHVVKVLDPVSLEYNSLRAWMTPSLLHVLENNRQGEYPQNIFEIGRVFRKSAETETKIAEEDCLGVLLCHQKADYTQIRQVYDYLLRMIGLEGGAVEEADHVGFIPGRIGEGVIRGSMVAFFGELHPNVIANFGLEMPAAGMEIRLRELWHLLEAGMAR